MRQRKSKCWLKRKRTLEFAGKWRNEMTNEIQFSSDVLVIGGGMAGCHAAINASKNGANVILVDKGYVSSSGQTPYADSYAVYNQEWGDDLDAWLEGMGKGGDYLNNRAWTKKFLEESYRCYENMLDFGVIFHRNPDGSLYRSKIEEFGPQATLFINDKADTCKKLRDQVLKSGAKIVDKVMMTDLLKKDERICGAVGISAKEGDFYVFKAKAVIICTGAAGLKYTGWPISELTADGDMMAYRAGASITGKEFNDPHFTSTVYPAYVGPGFFRKPVGCGPPTLKLENANGEIFYPLAPFCMSAEFEVHKGNMPIRWRTPTFKRAGERSDEFYTET